MLEFTRSVASNATSVEFRGDSMDFVQYWPILKGKYPKADGVPESDGIVAPFTLPTRSQPLFQNGLLYWL
jgi:hypothetical protein